MVARPCYSSLCAYLATKHPLHFMPHLKYSGNAHCSDFPLSTMLPYSHTQNTFYSLILSHQPNLTRCQSPPSPHLYIVLAVHRIYYSSPSPSLFKHSLLCLGHLSPTALRSGFKRFSDFKPSISSIQNKCLRAKKVAQRREHFPNMHKALGPSSWHWIKLGTVVPNTYNFNILEVESGGLEVQSQPKLYCKFEANLSYMRPLSI